MNNFEIWKYLNMQKEEIEPYNKIFKEKYEEIKDKIKKIESIIEKEIEIIINRSEKIKQLLNDEIKNSENEKNFNKKEYEKFAKNVV